MMIVFCPLMMGAGSQFFSLFEFLDLNPVEGAAVGLMYLELESNQVIGGESYDREIGSSSRDEDNNSSDVGSGSSRHQDRTQRQAISHMERKMEAVPCCLYHAFR